jgi:hypothetical protein
MSSVILTQALQCQSPTIIARILRNLINAYQRSAQDVDARLMADLLEMMDQYNFPGPA